jgi:hypothetical protein
MVIEIMLSARDGDDVTTTVSATVPVEHAAEAFVDTVVRYARGAAEHLRHETPRLALADRTAPEFTPFAAFVAARSRQV